MNKLQAHGMTKYELTKNTTGHKLCKFINYYIKTLQNAPNAQQTLTARQDTNTAYKNATELLVVNILNSI